MGLDLIEEKMRSCSTHELEGLVCLGIGRVLNLGSRPTKPGDVEEYTRVRSLVMKASRIIKSRQPDWRG
jgi:hypothetical protein